MLLPFMEFSSGFLSDKILRKISIGTAFAYVMGKWELMSKQEIYKIINSATLRLIIVFLLAAVAGVVMILSLSKLWML